jgi:16S rRNA (cytidine1402-2'-O)-methyltransferase
MGTLFLLPNVLDEKASHQAFFPSSVDAAVGMIDGLIAESEKGARRFLSRFSFPPPKTFRDIPTQLLNEHTTQAQFEELLKPLLKGESWGLISDCGLPCLADPGAHLVLAARRKGVSIQAFPGPSSLIFALMLSGLSAQHFTFHGYLPKEGDELRAKITLMEKRSREEGSTHLFIEAPYRNEKLLTILLKELNNATLLSLAVNLSLPEQWVMTQMVSEWKKAGVPPIDKRPAVFLLRAHLKY